MFGKKKVEAVLESKAIVEKKNATAGGMIMASIDQSGSFFANDMWYMINFRIGKKRKEFRVSREIYDRLEEGTKGLLVYDGSVFENFTVLEDENHEK